MSVRPRNNTAYAQYVFSNLPQAVRSGGGCYSYKELADLVGLKPTQHFRRRVYELIQMKELMLCPAFTPRGGIENRFQTAWVDTGSIPF